MNNPKISIIVPVYRVEKYLRRCVRSILAQTYQNFELILVDDGSPDNCPVMCDEFAKQDSRVIVIHKANGGLSDARNAGLDIAKGEYIGFVDSDDYIDPKMYEVLLKHMGIDKSNMAICAYMRVDEFDNRIDEVGRQPVKNRCFTREEFIEELLQPYGGYFVVAWNKLYRKEIFKTIRFPYGKQHEDEFVIHHIVAQCERITCIQEELYYYLQREGSIMAQGFNVRSLDYGEALIDRYYFTKKMQFNGWKNHSVSRLSYELEKWYSFINSSAEIHKKYNVLCKKSRFLVLEKNAWKDYGIKGKLYWKIELIAPNIAKILRIVLKKCSLF